MVKKKKTQKAQKPKKKQQESVFKEAWSNMSEDFNRFMPEKLRNKDKKPFVLWLFIAEVLVLGLLGKFVYDWIFK